MLDFSMNNRWKNVSSLLVQDFSKVFLDIKKKILLAEASNASFPKILRIFVYWKSLVFIFIIPFDINKIETPVYT